MIALCGALTYAEIGSRYPVTGGYYKIFSLAYHPSIAFSINSIILISNAASLSGVALIGAGYISKVFLGSGATDLVKAIIAMVAIILFYGINLMGLKMSSRTQNVLMVIKVSMLLLLVVALFFPQLYVQASAQLQPASHSPKDYILSFGAALIGVSFTYGGYQQTINFGAEVAKPGKNIPRGIFMGIFIIIVLYLTINYAYVRTIGYETLRTSKNIAAIMASKIFGVYAERILSVFLFLSVLAYVNVLLMSNPRVMYAMSEDKILPKIFRKRSEKTGALVVSLTAWASLCVLIVFWAKEFDTLLSFSIFLDCFGMALSAGSIFIVRKRTAHLDLKEIYSMKLYPLLPLVFIITYAFIAISLLINETKLSLIGLAVLVGFIILYFILQSIKKTRPDHAA